MPFAFSGRATRNFLVLVVVMHFILFIDRVNLAAAASVIQQDLGLSNIALGVAFSAFNYAYAPFQLIGGWFADRFGARRTLTVCGLTWSITTIVTGAVTGLVSLFAVRLVLGMGEGATLPAVTRALSKWTSLASRGAAVGITRAELAELPAADPAGQIGSGPVPWRRLVPRVAPLMIVYFCQGWTGWLFVAWMPSLLQKNYGLDLKKSSFLYAAMLFCAMIAEFLGGVVTDYLLRRTRNLQVARSRMIAASWILVVAGLVPAILVHDVVVGLTGFTVALFFLCFAIAPLWTATMDIAPNFAGSSSALMNAAGAVAGILSPVAFGWLLDRTGSWTTPFGFSVGLLLFAIVMTWWIRPGRPMETAPRLGRLAVAGE